MFQKTLIASFLLVLTVTLLTTSCSLSTSCEADDQFRVKDFILIESGILNADTQFPEFFQLGDDPLSYDRVAVSVIPDAEYFSSSNSRSRASARFELVKTAYACLNVIPQSSETITGITITSDVDYNEDFPAGSDLSEIIEILSLYFGSGYGRFTVEQYINSEPAVPDQLTFLLKEPPAESGSFRFTINITLDGELIDSYSETSRAILIDV